jgi:hypothetical protein
MPETMFEKDYIARMFTRNLSKKILKIKQPIKKLR